MSRKANLGNTLPRFEKRGVAQRKLSCRVAATADVAAFTLANPVLQNAGAIDTDGVTLIYGDRVLLAKQTTATENGIWYVGQIVGANCYMQRSEDAEELGDLTCTSEVTVEEGATLAGYKFKLATYNPVIPSTTAQTWTQVYPTPAGGIGIGAVHKVNLNADVTYMEDVGQYTHGHLFMVTGPGVAGQHFDFNGQQFALVVGGLPGACMLELQALINVAGGQAWAYTSAIAGDTEATLHVVRRTASAAAVVLATNIAGATVSAGATTGGAAPAVREIYSGEFLVKASDCTALLNAGGAGGGTIRPSIEIGNLPNAGAPKCVQVFCRDTNGIIKDVSDAEVLTPLMVAGSATRIITYREPGAAGTPLLVAAGDTLDYIVIV